MARIDLGGDYIYRGILDPVEDNDAANKRYVDSRLTEGDQITVHNPTTTYQANDAVVRGGTGNDASDIGVAKRTVTGAASNTLPSQTDDDWFILNQTRISTSQTTNETSGGIIEFNVFGNIEANIANDGDNSVQFRWRLTRWAGDLTTGPALPFAEGQIVYEGEDLDDETHRIYVCREDHVSGGDRGDAVVPLTNTRFWTRLSSSVFADLGGSLALSQIDNTGADAFDFLGYGSNDQLGHLTIEAGGNINITRSGNTVTIADTVTPPQPDDFAPTYMDYWGANPGTGDRVNYLNTDTTVNIRITPNEHWTISGTPVVTGNPAGTTVAFTNNTVTISGIAAGPQDFTVRVVTTGTHDTIADQTATHDFHFVRTAQPQPEHLTHYFFGVAPTTGGPDSIADFRAAGSGITESSTAYANATEVNGTATAATQSFYFAVRNDLGYEPANMQAFFPGFGWQGIGDLTTEEEIETTGTNPTYDLFRVNLRDSTLNTQLRFRLNR